MKRNYSFLVQSTKSRTLEISLNSSWVSNTPVTYDYRVDKVDKNLWKDNCPAWIIYVAFDHAVALGDAITEDNIAAARAKAHEYGMECLCAEQPVLRAPCKKADPDLVQLVRDYFEAEEVSKMPIFGKEAEASHCKQQLATILEKMAADDEFTDMRGLRKAYIMNKAAAEELTLARAQKRNAKEHYDELRAKLKGLICPYEVLGRPPV